MIIIMIALALTLTASAATATTPSPPGHFPQDLPGTQSQASAPTFTAWREHIAPHADEDRWLEIDWHDSTSAGVKAATKQNRPMLLWLMNGHPLGCT